MERSGSFLVTHADADSAIVRNVESGHVHALVSNPGVEEGDVIEGTVASEPPLEVAWSLVDVESRRSLSVERSDESPTRRTMEIAAEQDVGEVTRYERAGVGELHVLSVPAGRIERAIEDVLTDEETLARAARLGVRRVEVRSAADPGADQGVLSVRYLP